MLIPVNILDSSFTIPVTVVEPPPLRIGLLACRFDRARVRVSIVFCRSILAAEYEPVAIKYCACDLAFCESSIAAAKKVG